MTVRRTYKFRMYDSKQNQHLDDAILIAAQLWNHCIALHRRYYRMYGVYLHQNKLKSHLAKLKKSPKYAHWNRLGSQAIQDVAERIHKAYTAFFDHVKKRRSGRKSPPKFKKASRYRSFTLKQSGHEFYPGTNRVKLMGRTYKYVAHRPIEGTIKTVTVKRNQRGEYYLCVSVVQEWPDVPPRTGKAVGMDFGLDTFLTLDDGTKIASPLWFRQTLDDIRKANRAVSRCQRGSKNRKRALRKLEAVHETVSNRRRQWFFDLANSLTKQYADICIEDLNLDGMKRLWGRKVSDLAYTEFVSILQWTAVKNNAVVHVIDRWYPSSKTCHVCGYVHDELKLTDRLWTCPSCGTAHDRDINAAVNIRMVGMGTRG